MLTYKVMKEFFQGIEVIVIVIVVVIVVVVTEKTCYARESAKWRKKSERARGSEAIAIKGSFVRIGTVDSQRVRLCRDC